MPTPDAVFDPSQAFVNATPLPIHPTDNFHQFRDLPALIGPVAAVDRVFHAVRHVILKDFFFDATQCGAHRRDLSDDINAVAIVIDHLREPANLTFDAVQAFLTGCLDVLSHDPYIPPEGNVRKVGSSRW